MHLQYSHVNVFSPCPYGGNSLPVCLDSEGLSADQMLRITKELRHFEAIFLERTNHPNTVRARVFDLFEELPFAGHPIIGAAAVLHESSGRAEHRDWRVKLSSRTNRERPFETLVIWARNLHKAEGLRQRLVHALPKVKVHAETDIEAAVRRSDVLIATTLAREPIVHGEWLREGNI
jgi:predicted PhzF superfamily epimerase YddE/YHI9